MKTSDIAEIRRRMALLAASRAQAGDTSPVDIEAIRNDYVREVAARVEADPAERARVLAAHARRERKAARRAEQS